MFSYFKNYIDSLTNDKLFLGMAVLFLNIASRYIDLKLTKNQELLISQIGKEILVFFIIFLGTRDFWISITLTFIYWIFITFLFHEESPYCILPDNLKKLINTIDLNKDNKISEAELNYALKILEKSNNKYYDINNLNNFNNNNLNNSY